jgi:MinD superfamily P-loop ATPase
MKSLVVLSGKGGVGKSSIVASLAITMSEHKKIVCADCDVDGSNLSILFSIYPEDYEQWSYLSTNQIAIIDKSKCNGCKKCVDSCYFDALDFKNNYPVLKEFSCEGCGVCELVCPNKAITLKNVNNAQIGYAKTKYNFKIASAQLLSSSSGSGKVVAEVRKKAKDIEPNAEIMIIDSAAGIGCPVIASVTGNDYALLITEPTIAGYEDMLRAIDIVNHFNIKYSIIINKFDLNKKYCDKIELFAKQNNILIISKIPFDKSFVKAMVNKIPIVEYDEKYKLIFKKINDEIINKFLS